MKSNATYPLKLYLCNASASDPSTTEIVIHATGLFLLSTYAGAPEDAGNSNPDNDFRFDATLGTAGGYIFNLSTQCLASGTYGFAFTAGERSDHS